MFLQIFNKSLIGGGDREKTSLASAVTSGSSVLVTENANGFAADDYVIVGEIGSEKTELRKVSSVAGTSITVTAALTFSHGIGTSIYRIVYNQARFYWNSTNTTTGATTLTTSTIDPCSLFTSYEDLSNSTGYAFIRWRNSDSGLLSAWSSGILYGTGHDPKSLFRLSERTRRFLDETDKPIGNKITDEDITQEINDAQRDFAHSFLWSFFEVERSSSLVENQFQYSIDTDVFKVYAIVADSQPLAVTDATRWDLLHWDSNTTGSATHAYQLDRNIWLYPTPDASATTTTLGAALSATATSATVADSSDFVQAGFIRFKIDSEVIYATASTSTTFTGLLRGREGTTGASHTNGSTVTELDFVILGQEEPTDLLDAGDLTQIPEPDGLSLRAAANLAKKIKDFNLADRLMIEYKDWKRGMESKYGVKIASQFGVVRDASEVVSDEGFLRNQNQYPDGLTSS